ncbi:hypothetical protein H5410_005073 [Solanum commersonii]|uniref:FBD domain-containing protein n=1 Tax=Solanum commersonii TaxID=4109 RepID=A0A9J6A734_SOLCO|nr:hypothetical protein H5410_005073 [Solanum commersonii]
MLEEEDVSLPLLECRWLTINSYISKLSFPLLENLLRSTPKLENLMIFPDRTCHPFYEDEEIDLLEDKKYLSIEKNIFKVSLHDLNNVKVMPLCSHTYTSDATKLHQLLKFLLEHAINLEKRVIVLDHNDCNSCSTNISSLMKYLLPFPTSAIISLGPVSHNVAQPQVNSSTKPISKTKLKLIKFIHGEPTIEFTIDEVNEFSIEEGLHQAVILKYSYGKPKLHVLHMIIPKQLDIKSHCNIVQLEFCHLLIRFRLYEDFVQVLLRNSCYIKFTDEEILICCQIFCQKITLSIASSIGKPIVVDKATQEHTRPSTAKVKWHDENRCHVVFDKVSVIGIRIMHWIKLVLDDNSGEGRYAQNNLRGEGYLGMLLSIELLRIVLKKLQLLILIMKRIWGTKASGLRPLGAVLGKMDYWVCLMQPWLSKATPLQKIPITNGLWSNKNNGGSKSSCNQIFHQKVLQRLSLIEASLQIPTCYLCTEAHTQSSVHFEKDINNLGFVTRDLNKNRKHVN